MRVKDIMTKKVVSVNSNDNARQALEVLFKMRISGLPVIDDNNNLVGMFTEKEVIRAILPSYMEHVGIFVYQENPKATKQKIIGFADLKVNSVMRKDVVTVNEDTTLCEVAHLMIIKKIRRIIVLDKSKNVAGIVARGDLVQALFKEYT